ncbi:MAG: signal peptide peptidase SppA, partial [Myxococcota bacterium]
MSQNRPGAMLSRIGANLARGVRLVVERTVLPREGRVWLMVRLGGEPVEIHSPRLPFQRAPQHPTMLEALSSLEHAAVDPRVAGVVLRFGEPLHGMGGAHSLRRAVDAVRESGKPVVAFGDSYTAASMLVASGASRVYLPESGSVLVVGLRFEGFYLKGVLEHLDVNPEVVRVGSHKTAGERFTRDSMSPEEREQLEALADDFYGPLVDAVAQGRGLDPGEVKGLIDRGPHAARAAEEAGLVDGCRYPDEVEAELTTLAPETATDPKTGRPRVLDTAVYHALRVADAGWRPLLGDLPRIAYVVGRGTIHRGRGVRGMAADTVRELLEGLRRDEGVRGVVLRIDSPGGDAVASDLIWRSVRLGAEEKPVVVSMGDVAASGGYYVAAAAHAVFAEAATVTGSIGVVGGKLDLEGLYKKVGISRDAVERGARAGLLSEARGFTADERAAMQELLGAMYGTFLDRVAEGRGLAREDVAGVAQGRVWSGARARSHGLVDALGG